MRLQLGGSKLAELVLAGEQVTHNVLSHDASASGHSDSREHSYPTCKIGSKIKVEIANRS